MIVKKFEGGTVDEVQHQIASQMGPNAVILTSRKKDYSGFKALFFKRSVQIVAAIDDEDYKVFRRAQNKEVEEVSSENYLEGELRGFKERLFNALSGEAKEKGIFQAKDFLISKGLEKPLIDHLLTKVEKKWGNSSLVFQGPLREKALTSLQQILSEEIKTKASLHIKGKRPPIVFYGPRGSEKEEVIAKFACHLKEVHKIKVAVLGWQMGQWMGGKEALLAATSSCGVPVAFAREEQEWQKIKDEFNQSDVVLIDSDSLEPFPENDVTSIFVANALWKTDAVVSSYLPSLIFDSLIVTEVTALTHIASALNISFALQLPLSYLLCQGMFFQANNEELASSLLSTDALPSYENALF